MDYQDFTAHQRKYCLGNFKFPLDASSLSETGIVEVIDSLEITIVLFVLFLTNLENG